MKLLHITAVAGLVASAAAQGLISDLPSCAKNCFGNALPKACGLDIACICKNKAFLNNMACCVEPACDMADQKKTIEVAKKICLTGGVTDIPNAVHCDKGSSSGGETTSSSSSTTAMGSGATGNMTMTQTTASGSSMTSGTTSSSPTATTNAAVFGQNKDGSLMAAAGAAAAFAILV